ncbi:MAG: cyclase family protein [Chloroflexota bacterium]|nr:cyclase family protein [Chloroflexota bacterium]
MWAIDPAEIGPIRDLPPGQVLRAMQLVKQGKVIDLAAPRFRGMPLFPGHPTFEVHAFRTPRGLRVGGDKPWGPHNDIGLGYMSEVVSGSMHSGAHIDALAHMTIGPDARWYGGSTADQHLGDFGPIRGDGSKLPPLLTRGVFLDVPTYRGVDALPKGEPIGADELQAVARAQGVTVQHWDVVLIRTGLLRYWPDPVQVAEHRGAGPDLSAARWLVEQGAVATGSDTETYEVQPAPERGVPSNPQPVHTHLLIENGIYIMESIYLEHLARERAYEFLFIALPTKIVGTTGSMIDPVAVV